MWYVIFFDCVYSDVYGELYLCSLLLKIRPTPRPQPLLPGIILFKRYILLSLTHYYSLNLSTSFMLTPVNYFDYDITMESRNAILIHPLQERGVFEFDNNGVKQSFHCFPDAPPDFEYTEIGVVGVDGFSKDADRSAEIREAQEMFVRLKPVGAPNKIS